MKIILAAIGIIAVIGVIVGLNSRNKPADLFPDSNQADFIVAPLDTDVLKKNPSDQDFSKVEQQANFNQGTEIKTTATGRASLLYPNGTVTNLGRNSQITLALLEDNGSKSNINSVAGSVWSKVQNLSGNDEYEVETVNMVASVRGTIFAVILGNEKSAVYSLEHRVKVTPKDPKTGSRLENLAIEISSGEKTTVNDSDTLKNKKPTKEKITLADLNIEIIKDNIDSVSDRPEVRRVIDSVSPTNTPAATPSVSFTPRPTSTPVSTSSPQATATPTLTPTPTSTPVPTPTSTPSTGSTSSPQATPTPPQPVLYSVTPKILYMSQGQTEFSINGENISNTSQVYLNNISVPYSVIDSSTVFGRTNSQIYPGVYDVSIVVNGNKLTLYKAIEIR